MTIHPFFQELRSAREARGLTLAQISDFTRIAENHLEALESGEISMLPQAYVRAFIREYADMVGLKPEEVMRRYDAMLQGVPPPPPAPEPAPTQQPLPTTPPPAGPKVSRNFLTARNARWALLVVVAVFLGIFVWNTAIRQRPATTEEIPFQSILADKDKRLAGPQTPLPAAAPVTTPGTASDSLTLAGVTSDTVWVMVSIDQGAPREFIFKPKTRFSFKAKERFSVTLGNGGAVEFTLNQKNLGTLGKRGAIVRNVELTRTALDTR